MHLENYNTLMNIIIGMTVVTHQRTCPNYLGAKSGISGELGVSESGSKKINPAHYKCPI